MDRVGVSWTATSRTRRSLPTRSGAISSSFSELLALPADPPPRSGQPAPASKRAAELVKYRPSNVRALCVYSVTLSPVPPRVGRVQVSRGATCTAVFRVTMGRCGRAAGRRRASPPRARAARGPPTTLALSCSCVRLVGGGLQRGELLLQAAPLEEGHRRRVREGSDHLLLILANVSNSTF